MIGTSLFLCQIEVVISDFYSAQKLKEVQEFLWLPYRDLTSRQVRIHTAPLSRQVQNWEDVRKALKGTSYESFLYAN